MMTPPLLETKLHVPPLRPGLVNRPRLVARLQRGRADGRRLTLISAPAGFGKTTLLAAWTALTGPVAWLSLDEDDNEPSRFWTYVIAACQQIQSDLGAAALARLQSPSSPHDSAILTLLLNDLAACPDPVLLVLDDYQTITDQTIHGDLAYLLEYQPDNVHTAIATRADPPLPISQLRARGHLVELRARDLRFTAEEATTFLTETMRLSLSEQEVDVIETRTEGWAAGLQLAGLSMQGISDVGMFLSGFTGTHHYILEYLLDQVLDRESPDTRDFLLATSILERLCGPLCDAVIERQDSSHLLRDLHHRNLFLIPLDANRTWYRYHHLFSDLLSNLTRDEVPPSRIRDLHVRASRWFEAHGPIADAIKHALKAETFEQAASLIERAIQTTLAAGSVSTLLRWSHALPEAVVRAHPRLLMYLGWTTFLNGSCIEAKALLAHAEAALQTAQSAKTTSARALRGELLAMQATISMVETATAEAVAQAQEALKILPDGDYTSRARATRALGIVHHTRGETDRATAMLTEARSLALSAGNHFLAAEILSQLANVYAYRGSLQLAEETYQAIVELTPSPEIFPPAGLGYIGLAGIALERNDLQGAETALQRGVQLCEQGGIGYGLRPAYATQSLLLAAQGDRDGALAAIAKASQFRSDLVLIEGSVSVASHQVRLRLQIGDRATARLWAKGTGLVPNMNFDELPLPFAEIHAVTRARMAWAHRQSAEVLRIAEAVAPQAEVAGRLARVIELSLLAALAYRSLDRRTEAIAALSRCLDLAAPEGYRRLFLEAGTPLVPLLRAVIGDGIQSEYAGQLLADLRTEQTSAASEAVSTTDTSRLEPLTPRELEVLRLIEDGLSNQQIAERLVVSLNTVKKHTSNLYGKLGVRRRTQAVGRARDLGLL